MSKRKKAPAITLKPGDRVLLGRFGVSQPSDWFFATVLWTDGEEVLTEHTDLTGNDRFRQVMNVSYVRAIGDYASLIEFKERCRVAVKALAERVEELETETKKARDAVWTKLDEIGAGVPRFADEPEPAR